MVKGRAPLERWQYSITHGFSICLFCFTQIRILLTGAGYVSIVWIYLSFNTIAVIIGTNLSIWR